jgi:MFS family permease
MLPSSAELYINFYGPSLFIYLAKSLPMAALPLYAIQILGKSNFTAGVITACAGLGRLLADLPAGYLIDKIGQENSIVISSILMIFSSFICALGGLKSVEVIAATQIVFGAGMGLLIVSWQVMIQQQTELKNEISASIGGISRFSSIFAPVIGAVLYSAVDMKAVWLTQMVISTMPLLIRIGFKETGDPQVDKLLKKPEKSPVSARGIGQIFASHKRQLIEVGLFFLGLQGFRESRRLLFPLLGVSIGLNAAEITSLISFSYVFDFLLFPVAAMLYASLGTKLAATTTVTVFVIALFFLSLVSSGGGISMLWMGAILIGIANGLSAGLALAIGAEMAPPDGGASFAGVFRFVCDSGEFLAPIMAGLFFQLSIKFAFFGLVMTGVGGLYAYVGDDLKENLKILWKKFLVIMKKSWKFVSKKSKTGYEFTKSKFLEAQIKFLVHS